MRIWFFGDEDSDGNADFMTIFLYLIRRVENVWVGRVAIGYEGFGENEREIKEIYRLFREDCLEKSNIGEIGG